MESVFKARKRGGAATPSFSTLGEQMNQGSGQKHGKPPHGLAQQMQQGGGYSHGDAPKLRKAMGQ